MIDPEHALPLTRQSRILELSRSSLYYEAVPISDRDLQLMRLIDEIHLKYPFYGIRRIRNELRDLGHDVGRGHVSTLMKKMGIRALYQKPRLSKPNPEHKIYPYLLRGLEITRANHVWATDITYLPMARGFCYLVAIMDWASRRVMAWRLSNTLDASFCTEALEEAITKYGTPEIFNTDQGSQFTSEAFIDILNTHEHQYQHGWQRALGGQCIRRKTVEEREVRRYLSEGLRLSCRGQAWACRLFRVLQ